MAEIDTTATVNGANSTVETAQVTAPATAGTETATAGKTISMEEAERIATERSTRAESSALKSYFQQQGLTEEEAKQAVEKFKTDKAAKSEAEKGDLTKMQQKAAEAEAKAAKVEADAFNDLIDARAEAIASSLGIDPAKLPYIRLDFSKVGKTDTGKPKADDIKAVLEGALKIMPELKKTAEPIQTGVAPTNGGKPITNDEDAIRKAMGLPPKK